MRLPVADGYYRFPAIHGDRLVFVCEDDLWTVAADGGEARRLTSGVGEAAYPCFSPDGRRLAFSGRDEGPGEVFVMPSRGGPSRRLTFLGSSICRVAGWTPDGNEVLFAANAQAPLGSMVHLFSVPAEGGLPRLLPYGMARTVSYGPRGARALGRHGADPARWKRYRGGTAGQIWVDRAGRGRFERIHPAEGNLSRPMWIDGRIFFLSDHEGIGNLYSCRPDGTGVRRHTHHADFYARHPATDGRRIVYHAGADLWILDPRGDGPRRVPVSLQSPRTQRARKFPEAEGYLESFAPHPKGHSLALTVRGRPFTMGNWEGAVVQHGAPHGVRYRLAGWLPDGKRFVAVSDEGGEESLVVLRADGARPPKRLRRLDIGRPVEMAVSPKEDAVAIANHRCELVWVDLRRGRMRVLDRSAHGRIDGIAWSPDGRWVAYGRSDGPRVGTLRLCRVPSSPGSRRAGTGGPVVVTNAILRDIAPAFDPGGKYLYFLSHRVFDPVYDNMLFDLGFPRGMRPYLVTLRADLRSPFEPEPRPLSAPAQGADKKKGRPAPLTIDLAGIRDRVVPLPLPEGRYGRIAGIPGGVLVTSLPIQGALSSGWRRADDGALEILKFDDGPKKTVAEGVTDFAVSADGSTVVYRAGDRLRAIAAGDKTPDRSAGDKPSRRSGWIDLSRVKVEVDPGAEWGQMLRESWRLMRDHFWTQDLSGIDWRRVLRRYLPLVDRVATRGEFSDLVWEMQGETGTSHCYESGGDYREPPGYDVGSLGAEYAWDARRRGWRIARILRGDPSDPKATSPLTAPGTGIREGDVLRAIDGRALTREVAPPQLLVNRAGREVTLSLASGRAVTVRALAGEQPTRYRAWVESNRRRVHERSRGRIGYVHIPDMGPHGFAEFHRLYLAEADRPALLVDVRFNGGGHVSQLLIEELRRERIGYDIMRWGTPHPYPEDSPAGPMACLTNELAGSDGDMFSHAFKLYRLGPLLGTRTWGGVVGIWPRHALVDGSVTTQPEFAFWFRDVGFGIENHGTDPDIEIDIAPQDAAAGRDPQLDRTIEVLLDLLRRAPRVPPDFGPRPRLPLPRRLPRAAT